ncbi:Membrane insertion protein, OxaA/YidC with tetratricopeptide repeat domain, partial [Prunus dulcis]
TSPGLSFGPNLLTTKKKSLKSPEAPPPPRSASSPVMATSKLSSHIRRLRPSAFNFLPALSHARQFHYLTNPNPNPNSNLLSPHPPWNSYAFPQTLTFSHSRFLSSSSSEDSDFVQLGVSGADSAAQSELLNLGGCAGEEYLLPVRALISVLDGFHDLTLPPPLPPPFSGKSSIDQISLFRKERSAIGCPSLLWFLASFSVQVPCFLLWLNSIRRMSLGNHPGFDCGGTLWFNNLAELPHGVYGAIFPFLIAGLHYANVQISFKTSSLVKGNDLLSNLAKYYKFYLDIMTLPIIVIGFCIPQGSLVYWVTNSSLSVIQQLVLKDPAVRAKLGLPDKDAPTDTAISEKPGTPEISPLASPTRWKKITLQNLSPTELLNVFLQHPAWDSWDSFRSKLALEKDPEYARALIVMGQTLLQKSLHAEATQYFSVPSPSAGQPTEVEDIDLLILASQWAGVAYIRQGKSAEGIVHLERVAQLEEPDEPSSKTHYFEGLLLLSSALSNVGRKAEALKYLRLAAAYNPDYNEYLEQYENENEDESFVGDLIGSRRRDY